LRTVSQPESDDAKLDSAIARYDGVAEDMAVSDDGYAGEDADAEDDDMEAADIDGDGEEDEGKIASIDTEV